MSEFKYKVVLKPGHNMPRRAYYTSDRTVYTVDGIDGYIVWPNPNFRPSDSSTFVADDAVEDFWEKHPVVRLSVNDNPHGIMCFDENTALAMRNELNRVVAEVVDKFWPEDDAQAWPGCELTFEVRHEFEV